MTLNGVMALFCVISANSGSFRAHCVKVHDRYLISWWVLLDICELRDRQAYRQAHRNTLHFPRKGATTTIY